MCMKVEEAQKRNDIRNTIPFYKAQKGIETENGIDKAEIAWETTFVSLFILQERARRSQGRARRSGQIATSLLP